MAFKKTGAPVNIRPLAASPSILITEIPSKQPMAYAEGFRSGLFGPEVDQKDRSPIWLEGFQHGLRVRSGEEEPPPWLIEGRGWGGL